MVARRRLAQGFDAVFAFARSPDFELARRHLNACEYRAFRSMSRSDQLHSLKALKKTLEADPAAPKALISAALLHDVGKSRYHLSVPQKSLAVIIEAIAPGLSRRLGEDETLSFWRAPFVLRRRHARWSGEILRECEADADAIWLAEHHQEDAERCRDHRLHRLLTRLQSADGES